MVRRRKITKKEGDKCVKQEVNSTLNSDTNQDDTSNETSPSSLSAANAMIPKHSFSDSVKCNCKDTETESGTSSDSNSSAAPSSSRTSNTSSKKSARCCFKQRFFSFLNRERFCDIVFIVGQGDHKQQFSAHKGLLSAGSEVFEAMFSDDWSPASDKVIIPDVEPFAFSNLLRYLYIEEVSLTSETVGATLYAAKKYAIGPLEKRCIDYFIENLQAKNAFAVLTHARSFDEQKLMESCFTLIDEETSDAISAKEFTEIDSKLLRVILERDSLNIQEVKLFKAVYRWSVYECGRKGLPVTKENLRLVLEELLPLVRFPLMTNEEVLSIVTPKDLLTEKQLLSVCTYLSTNSKPPVDFNTAPRFWTKFKVRRFQETSMPFNTCKDRTEGEAIEFQVDRKLQFLGIKMYGSIVEGAQYSVRLQLTQCSSNKVIREESSVYTINGTNTEFEVLLKSPVWLTPNTDYEIWASIQGPPTFFGKKGMKKVTVALSHDRNVTITFANVQRGSKNPRTNVEQGQIPEIIFST